MSEIWICSNCGSENEPADTRCYSCLRKRTLERIVVREVEPLASPPDECSKCKQPIPTFANVCPKCGTPTRPNRLDVTREYPRADGVSGALCYLPSRSTLILHNPSPDAERLYLCGESDILVISGEEGNYYRVALPAGEHGFVEKNDGKVAEIGIGKVEDPLGYVRPLADYAAEVILVQPNGEKETVYELKNEDRLPVIEERSNYFVVQLPSGIWGRVHKARVIRTLRPDSLPEKKGIGLGTILGAVALVGIGTIGAIIGTLGEDSDEAKMRRAFSSALRERGY